MPRYTITEHLVSGANPVPTPFIWVRDASATQAMRVLAAIIDNNEETSEHFDEFTTRSQSVTVEVSHG